MAGKVSIAEAASVQRSVAICDCICVLDLIALTLGRRSKKAVLMALSIFLFCISSSHSQSLSSNSGTGYQVASLLTDRLCCCSPTGRKVLGQIVTGSDSCDFGMKSQAF